MKEEHWSDFRVALKNVCPTATNVKRQLLSQQYRFMWGALFIAFSVTSLAVLPEETRAQHLASEVRVNATSADGTLVLKGKDSSTVVVVEEGTIPKKAAMKVEGSVRPSLLTVSLNKSVLASAGRGKRGNETLEILQRLPKVRSLATFESKDTFWSLAIAPDGSSAAVGTDKGVIVVSAKTGKSLLRITTKKRTCGLCYSPDGTQLALGDNDGGVSLWSLKSGKMVWGNRFQRADVAHLAFSPDGKMLASGSEDGSVRLSQSTTGTRLHHFIASRKSVSSLAFSKDNKLFGSVGRDQCVVVWDIGTGQVVYQQPIRLHTTITTLAFSTNSCLVFTSGDYRKVVDAKSGKVLHSSGDPNNK